MIGRTVTTEVTVLADALRGITFDWWGTLYRHRETRARRVERICEVLHQHGHNQRPDAVDAAYRVAAQRFEAEWQAGRVYLPSQWLADTLEQLGVALPKEVCLVLQHSLEETMLEHSPVLAEGAASLLSDLHRAGIRLGIVSDTGLTVGRVMRRILDRHGILPYFSGFAFSDEVGVTKPHRRAFRSVLEQLGLRPEEAAHVGDLPQTDIQGAKEIGMRAILITGVSQQQDNGNADAVVEDFAELRELLDRWEVL